MAASTGDQATALAVVATPAPGETRPAVTAQLSPQGDDRTKRGRQHMTSPVTGITLDQKVASLRQNVADEFQSLEVRWGDRVNELERRLKLMTDQHEEQKQNLDNFATDLPNRYASVDVARDTKVRLDVAIANVEDFGNKVNLWTVKSDENAGRIDIMIGSLGDVTKRLGDITSATIGPT
jgi:hypothetical protein